MKDKIRVYFNKRIIGIRESDKGDFTSQMELMEEIENDILKLVEDSE